MLQICEDRLVLTSMRLCGTLPPYVALSHCWGSCLTLKTLSSNIEGFRIGIERRDLPLTFKDAVKVTESLGFHYIWIDSLCIIQDSLTDWEEQSSLMALVYGNADLVLAASSASSTEDGFLKERKGYRESSLRLASVQNQSRAVTLRYRLLQPKFMQDSLDPLDRRAWALQERLLARRYLAIGSHDTSWTCRTSSACECEWWRVASIWRNNLENINRILQDKNDEEVANCWREMVLRHYCHRALTVPSDNLVAISAIASIFHNRLKADYLAGIWQKDMIRGLLWTRGQPWEEHMHASALENSAPSWSWASLPSLDFDTRDKYRGLVNNKNLVRVLDAKTTPSTMNPFGSVRSGVIKLWGQLWRAEAKASELAVPTLKGRTHWLKVEGYIKNKFILFYDMSLMMVDVYLSDGGKERSMRRVRNDEIQERFYIGNLQEHETTVNLSMIPLLKEIQGRQGSKRTITHGLMLGRSPEDPAKFERVGLFTTYNLTAINSQAHDEHNLGDMNEQEIVII